MKPFPLLELPSELCLHVLTRLPLKYLMRLRCVSKFFLDLTNNPNFITSHRKSNTPPNDDFNFMDTTTTTSLVSSSNEWQCQWPWRFHVLFKGSNYIYSHKHDELIPFHCPSEKLLISSMNGLVCFGGCYSLEIYNILAGTHYNVISPFYTPTTIRSSPSEPLFVFGYDPISNDYMILRIESRRCWAIYSFRTNTWKRMNFYWDYATLYDNSEEGRSVCINGVIYWPPGRREYLHYNEIVLFDLHKEKFSEIQLPEEDILLPTQYADIQLLSFRGCLAFAFIQRTSLLETTTPQTKRKSRKKKRIDKPISYYEDIVREAFKRKRGGGGGVISEEEEKAVKNYGDMQRKILSEERNGQGENARSLCGDILVELFILKNNNGRALDEAFDENVTYDHGKEYFWNRESFVVPIPPPSKEVEIVSCCDEIFLGWFESNQLRLYNLHTKCLFSLPLSPPSHYYPKVSFVGKKENDPTYVDNFSFDFSLN